MDTRGDGRGDVHATADAAPQPAAATAGRKGAARLTRVLIVEDEQDIAALIKHTLERSGEMQASIVGSGDAALRVVAERPPDLLILDLNLPVLSSIAVRRVADVNTG